MLSHRNINTAIAHAALALAILAYAVQAQTRRAATESYNRGVALAQRGEFDRAIAEFDQAIELDPHLADAWCYRGNAYNSKGDPDRAMADINRAIALSPRHSAAH